MVEPDPVELLPEPQPSAEVSSARRVITGKAVRMSHIKASMASSSSLEVEFAEDRLVSMRNVME